MMHSSLLWFRNNSIVNFFVVWGQIFSKLLSILFHEPEQPMALKEESKKIVDKSKSIDESTNNKENNDPIYGLYETKEIVDDTVVIKENDLYEFFPERDVKFLLYTRLNPVEPQIIPCNDVVSLKESYFNSKKPVRFLIHGWLDNGYGELGSSGRKAYLQHGEFNVISVDWSGGADTPNYFKAKSILYQVGPILANYIDFLISNTTIKTTDIYLVGHSLGAHIAGMAGKYIKSGKINTIYGLDPAGPMFFTFLPKERLDVGDANYVEVIHTSYQGFGKPIGYSDFYINGGKIQPGCNILSSCSHMRSISYWAESINTKIGFWAIPMEDNEIFDDSFDMERKMVRMGGEPSNEGMARGVYKLETASASPYALGKIEYNPIVAEEIWFDAID